MFYDGRIWWTRCVIDDWHKWGLIFFRVSITDENTDSVCNGLYCLSLMMLELIGGKRDICQRRGMFLKWILQKRWEKYHCCITDVTTHTLLSLCPNAFFIFLSMETERHQRTQTSPLSAVWQNVHKTSHLKASSESSLRGQTLFLSAVWEIFQRLK